MLWQVWRYWEMHQCSKVQPITEVSRRTPRLPGHNLLQGRRTISPAAREKKKPKLRSHTLSKGWRRGSSRISQVLCKAVAKTKPEVDTSWMRTAQGLRGGQKSEPSRERHYSECGRSSWLRGRGPATVELVFLSSLHPVSRRSWLQLLLVEPGKRLQPFCAVCKDTLVRSTMRHLFGKTSLLF